MNKITKRIIYLLMLIVPLAIVYVTGQTALDIHKEKFVKYKDSLSKYAEEAKEKEIQAYEESKKQSAKVWVDNMMLVFTEKYTASEMGIKKELQKTIDIAYAKAHEASKKYKNKKKYEKTIRRAIKLELSKIRSESGIFLVDYKGNTLYGSNAKEDINARTILLEEIQKVRRRGGGYIVSDVDHRGGQRHIIVKDIGINKLFIGVDLYVNTHKKELKENLLDLVKYSVFQKNDCVRISEANKDIYRSLSCANIEKSSFEYESYSKELDWTLSYGFDVEKKKEFEIQKLKSFESQMSKF